MIDIANIKNNPALLEGSRVVVFGGTGFIGSHLIDALLSLNCSVLIAARSYPGLVSPDKLNHPSLHFQIVDITNAELVDNVLQGIDIVFHLASGSLPQSSNDSPKDDVSINLQGSLNILNSCVNNNVKKFVFLSSGGTVYGIPKHVPITENHSTEPICSYGITKLAIEKYIALYRYHHHLDCVILRLANPYGERQRLKATQGVVPVFISCALADQPLYIWGDGSVVRDFLHVSDVVQAILKSCNYHGSEYIFNVGSGSGMSLLDLVKTIEDIHDFPLRIIFQEARTFDVPTNVLSIELAKRHLNWAPQIPATEGLTLFYRYLKSFNQ